MAAYPILEFDPALSAVIEPIHLIKRVEFPRLAVACFFHEVIRRLVEDGRANVLALQRSEMGDHPIYSIEYEGQQLAVFHPTAGAPMAAALVEEVIAHGAKAIIGCGGSGALDAELSLGQAVVPISAIRDEGTSYHYLPPSREVEASPAAVAAISAALRQRNISYVETKTWTTDAVYRETHAKVIARRAEGCRVVEMEAAALFAVGRFRRVAIGELLYAGDSVASGTWEHREWNDQTAIRESIFWLACDAVCQIRD
jgi:uridine phosphorylase